ncbi:hypothetical protein GCM10010421_60400 [Streptomyces glaucus]|uniref:Secreted protein n=1 Tax=Streptomyces glaucus TaxID=284029 RepID=A0ABN3KGJ1_9ACTN
MRRDLTSRRTGSPAQVLPAAPRLRPIERIPSGRRPDRWTSAVRSRLRSADHRQELTEPVGGTAAGTDPARRRLPEGFPKDPGFIGDVSRAASSGAGPIR